MEKIALTITETAELLNVSKATLYTMTRKNEIPFSKIRGKILFHKPTIEQWLINGASMKNGGGKND